MDLSINWLAVVVSGVLYFLLGWLWYSPALFAKLWIKARGIDPAQMGGPDKRKTMMQGMALTFVGSIVMAAALAVLLGATHADTVVVAIEWSFLASIGFVAMVTGANALFDNRSPALYLINTGYPVVGYVIMAVVLTLWK